MLDAHGKDLAARHSHTAEDTSTVISNRLSVRSPSQTDTPQSTPTCLSPQPPAMLFPMCLHTCLLLLLHWQHSSSEVISHPAACPPRQKAKAPCCACSNAVRMLLTPQALHHPLSSSLCCLEQHRHLPEVGVGAGPLAGQLLLLCADTCQQVLLQL